MSNISRRDFLKTAGVMTLAVAAAGVLAGCEGNAPETPVTGAKAPGEITKLGDVEFSVVKAVEQNNVKYTYEQGNSGVTKKSIEAAVLRIQVSVRNTKLGTDKLGLNKKYFTVYVDDKAVTPTNTDKLEAKYAEKLFGVKEDMLSTNNLTAQFPSMEATNYHASYNLTIEDGVVKKPSTIKVVYKDIENMIVAEYNVPVAAVVELENGKDY